MNVCDEEHFIRKKLWKPKANLKIDKLVCLFMQLTFYLKPIKSSVTSPTNCLDTKFGEGLKACVFGCSIGVFLCEYWIFFGMEFFQMKQTRQHDMQWMWVTLFYMNPKKKPLNENKTNMKANHDEIAYELWQYAMGEVLVTVNHKIA